MTERACTSLTPEEVRLIAGASMDYERRLVAVITRLDGQVQRLATYLDAVTDDRQVVAEERDRLNARLAERLHLALRAALARLGGMERT